MAHNGTFEEISILHLFPFTNDRLFTGRSALRSQEDLIAKQDIKRWTPVRIAKTGYAFTAAAFMAIRHFNDRNAVLVPELQDSNITEGCTVQLTTAQVADTALQSVRSGKVLLDGATSLKVDAVLGPYHVDSAEWT